MCDDSTEPILVAYQMGAISRQEAYWDLINLGVPYEVTIWLLDRQDGATGPKLPSPWRKLWALWLVGAGVIAWLILALLVVAFFGGGRG